MNLSQGEQVSVLAAVTGLVLIAFHFIATWFAIGSTEWLLEMIVGVTAFELFMFVQAAWDARKQRRGGDHG